MSDTEQDAATPDTAGLVGREERLVAAGYSVKKDPEPVEETYSSSTDGLRQAADEVAAQRPEPEDPLVPMDMLGDLDPKLAVTVEQAASELSSARADISIFTEGLDLAKYVDEIDAKRADVVAGKPEVAKALGLDEVPNDPELTKADSIDAATAAAIDDTPGLDPETRKALKIPAVRAALEHHFAEIDTAQRGYAQALNTANQFAMANLVDHFPELGSIPVEQWEAGLNFLAQRAPQRFNRAMGVLQRFGQVQTAQRQWDHEQAQVRHQQFVATRQEYSRAADVALGPMSVAEKHQMADELVDYVGEYGISRQQLAREAETNLALHHPAFQRMAADAVRYQRLTKSPAKAAPRPVLPVQRPGTAPATPRGNAPSAKIQALETALSSARGDKAVRIASQIESLRRKSS